MQSKVSVSYTHLDVYKRQGYNLKVIDKLDPDSTASMQKDIAKGHESEIQGLLFRCV